MSYCLNLWSLGGSHLPSGPGAYLISSNAALYHQNIRTKAFRFRMMKIVPLTIVKHKGWNLGLSRCDVKWSHAKRTTTSETPVVFSAALCAAFWKRSNLLTVWKERLAGFGFWTQKRISAPLSFLGFEPSEDTAQREGCGYETLTLLYRYPVRESTFSQAGKNYMKIRRKVVYIKKEER